MPLIFLAILVELSDIGDGLVARNSGQESLAGNIYDSMADHVARMTEFVSLMGLGVVGAAPILVFLWRDGAVVTTRLIAAVSGARFPTTRTSGKLKGIAQGLCLVWLSATQSIPMLGTSDVKVISDIVVWGAVLVTIVSGLDYLLASWLSSRGGKLSIQSGQG
jgi:CDP-diacylglycerol--glycerol-3-phosphate 3-phosphatidyltransferase